MNLEMTSKHPDHHTFALFLRSALPIEKMQMIKAHLVECDECMTAYILMHELLEEERTGALLQENTLLTGLESGVGVSSYAGAAMNGTGFPESGFCIFDELSEEEEGGDFVAEEEGEEGEDEI